MPSDWVVRWSHLISPGGAVLDLACGPGRHVRYLASRGHKVVACDRDGAALLVLEGGPGVETVRADLEDGSPWPFGTRQFQGIVVTNYLHRPLFAAIASALSPGGVLIYETFALGNERFGKPSNPDFLLRKDELLGCFGPGMAVAGFEQGIVHRPKPAVVQRACMVRAEALLNDLEPRKAPDSVKILG